MTYANSGLLFTLNKITYTSEEYLIDHIFTDLLMYKTFSDSTTS